MMAHGNGAIPKNVISYERTVNSHLPEGLAGGPEGSYTGLDFVQSRLKTYVSAAKRIFRLNSVLIMY